MHNWPPLPAGQIGLNSGPMMSSADRVEITICGKGGHGAHPHLAVDPVVVAAHIITAAQTIVSRNVAPLDNAVISLCALQAGSPGAFSVVPREAKLIGTVRTSKIDTQELVERRITELAESIARAFGAEAQVVYERIYPATINHPVQARFAGDVAAELVGEDNVVRNLEPSMGAEDFSFMLQASPGAICASARAAAHPTVSCTTADTISTTPSFRSAPRFSRRSLSAECPFQSIDHRGTTHEDTASAHQDRRCRRGARARNVRWRRRRRSNLPIRAMRCRWIRTR